MNTHEYPQPLDQRKIPPGETARSRPAMSRLKRFALHAVLPPLLGGLLAGVALFATGGGVGAQDFLLGFLFVLVAAYAIAIGPSLIYAGLMEWAFHCGLRPGSAKAVGLSSGLGCLVGSIPLLGELWLRPQPLQPGALAGLWFFSAIGLVVGVGVEVLVTRWARPAAARAAATVPTSDRG